MFQHVPATRYVRAAIATCTGNARERSVDKGAREACTKAVHSQQVIARMVMGVQDKALSATQKNAYLKPPTQTITRTKRLK